MARGYIVTPERRRRVAQAQELREQGLSTIAIGKQMGLSRTLVSDLLSDPWRDKANQRRLRYGGECSGCGEPTDGSGGLAKAPPELCSRCSAQRQHEARQWTKEKIVAAIQRFHSETGRQPVSQHWLGGNDKPDWAPWTSTVLTEFGSWSAAMKAAGFESYKGIKINVKGRTMYHVLAETKDGTWRELGLFAGNRSQAINAALAEHPPENGNIPRIVLVHNQGWIPQTVAPVQRVIYELVAQDS